MFENIRADFHAQGRQWGSQGFWALVVYRFGRWRYTVRPAPVRKAFSVVYHVLFKLVQIATGIELPCEVAIGRNFRIDHYGGIVISGTVRFGDNCRIRNGVVIGVRHADDPRVPTFGHDVDIGAGAKILGAVTVGDHVLIGANAVVIRDVPAHSLAVGVPAVVKRRRRREAAAPEGSAGKLTARPPTVRPATAAAADADT